MAEPFDTLAAQLTDVIERLAAGSVGSFDASAEIAAIMSGLAPDQWAQLTQVIQVMGRVDGMLFVTGTPATTLGTVGSTAVDLVNGKFWPPKTELGWTTPPIDFVGATGPAGTITSVTAEGVAPGAAPEVVLGGTPAARTMLFRIPAGAQGVQGDEGPVGPQGPDTASLSLEIMEGFGDLPLTISQAAAHTRRGIHLKFAEGYFRNGLEVETSITDLAGFTCVRSTGGYGPNLNGTWTWFGVNVPRLTNWGLTVEGSATNLLLHSSDFTNAVWTKLRGTASKTAAGADGTANSASILTATGADATFRQDLVASSALRTTSIIIRRRTGTGKVALSQGAPTTGTDLIVNGGFATDTNWSKGSGWVISGGVATWTPGDASYLSQLGTIATGKLYRLTFTIVSSSGNANAQVYFGNAPAVFTSQVPGTYTVFGVATGTALGFAIRAFGTTGNISVDNVSCVEVVETELALTSDWQHLRIPSATMANPAIMLRLATSGDAVDVWNLQHEASAFATSPIITGGSTATRAADQLRIDGVDLGGAMTLLADLVVGGQATDVSAGARYIADVSNGPADRVSLWFDTSTPRLKASATKDSVVQADLTVAGSAALRATVKPAVRVKDDDFRMAGFAGALSVLDSSGVAPSGMTRVTLGGALNNTLHLNGLLRELAIIPAGLADAGLQSEAA